MKFMDEDVIYRRAWDLYLARLKGGEDVGFKSPEACVEEVINVAMRQQVFLATNQALQKETYDKAMELSKKSAKDLGD